MGLYAQGKLAPMEPGLDDSVCVISYRTNVQLNPSIITDAFQYINWGTNTIKAKECMDGMGKEAYGCKHGGQTGYWNWEYM